MNDKDKTFIEVAETFLAKLGEDQLRTLRGLIATRDREIVMKKLRSGVMPWASDEEMQLCKEGERIKAIKAYQQRTKKLRTKKERGELLALPDSESFPKSMVNYECHSLMSCKQVIDCTWRVREVAGFVIDHLKEGEPGMRLTFFNILDNLAGTPRRMEYEELRDSLDYLLRENIIGEEVPEGDETKTTDIWLKDWMNWGGEKSCKPTSGWSSDRS